MKSRGLKEVLRLQAPCTAQHRGRISPLHHHNIYIYSIYAEYM